MSSPKKSPYSEDLSLEEPFPEDSWIEELEGSFCAASLRRSRTLPNPTKCAGPPVESGYLENFLQHLNIHAKDIPFEISLLPPVKDG